MFKMTLRDMGLIPHVFDRKTLWCLISQDRCKAEVETGFFKATGRTVLWDRVTAEFIQNRALDLNCILKLPSSDRYIAFNIMIKKDRGELDHKLRKLQQLKHLHEQLGVQATAVVLIEPYPEGYIFIDHNKVYDQIWACLFDLDESPPGSVMEFRVDMT